MRYWVYINDKVDGPFEVSAINAMEGITPETLVLPEGQDTEWVSLGSVSSASPAPQPSASPAEGYSAASSFPPGEKASSMFSSASGSEESSLAAKIEELSREISMLREDLSKILPSASTGSGIQEPLSLTGLGLTPSDDHDALRTKTVVTDSNIPVADVTASDIAADTGLNITPEEKTDTGLSEMTPVSESRPGEYEASSTGPVLAPLDSAMDDIKPAEIEPMDVAEAEVSRNEQFSTESFTSGADVQPLNDDISNTLNASASSPIDIEPLDTVDHTKDELHAEEVINGPADTEGPLTIESMPSDFPVGGAPEAEPEAEVNVVHDSLVDTSMGAMAKPVFEENKDINEMNFEDLNAAPPQGGIEEQLTFNPEVVLEQAHENANMEEQLVRSKPLVDDKLDNYDDDAHIVSSALDSMYSSPPVKENNEPLEFEDLMRGASDSQSQSRDDMTNLSSVPEVNLNDATSLISDFIPPSDLPAGDSDKKEDLRSSDILAQTPAKQTQKAVDPLAAQYAAAISESEQQPKVKRVKSAEIKTDPLIAGGVTVDGGFTEDLSMSKIEGIDQFGTMEEDEDFEPESKGKFKKVLLAIVVIVLCAGVYFAGVFMGVIPDHLGVRGDFPPAAPSAPSQPAGDLYNLSENEELAHARAAESLPLTLSTEVAVANTPGEVLPLPGDSPSSQAASFNPDSVIAMTKSYRLPSGTTLENLIISQHNEVKDFIEWTAIETTPDNFSVTAKVPPGANTPIRMVYRFNYNTANNTLTPTTSDSRNLLAVK
ncbi:hypothetical protein Dip518_001520 [Parelusimicrobium proximum]|uniref:DUF4339 domain-containing protein n=1 Tax=Parelusimicrobium proximum TaxID=3228953 RepID=UPI003D16C779